MELKYLQTLKTILETGSFLGAARKLNYTQSTVTFQIQQLEQELSVKLFEKIGREMVLTQAGEDILP
ncbi:LysR family transcriptional regulator [Metabacillus sp. RGM 3146]|uniref:LysR family transcriptional regulator n=1 Tax=Metabacillus sp. RGM 3146 TaxID=3401092 RepID=UPI003B99AED2